MKRIGRGTQDYQARLSAFLSQIDDIKRMSPKEDYLYAIMDTVPFRDLEIALMMAKLENGQPMTGNA